MDLTSSVAIVTAGSVLKAPAQEFLKRLSGPAADEIGGWIRDAIHDFRKRNTARTFARAEEMLNQAGREAHAVPLRTLLPLLEGASVEDDSSLGELWAALLANAADSGQVPVPPIFPAILGQLTPFDARLLVELRDLEQRGLRPDSPTPAGEAPPPRWGARRVEVAAGLGISEGEELDVGLDTLSTLGLVENEPVVRTTELEPGSIFFSDTSEFRLSALGRRFIRACTAPT